jgi:small subunit ribosomal protein S2
MAQAELRDLLEAGVHFGHQTRRWNPNMRRFIFGEMDGIHIIDLLQTEALLENARKFAGELATGGGTVLFVGTKKQARDTVQEWAERCKMPYVNKRWLGGLLTNFNTMSGRIARLHELNGWKEEGKLDLLPTKERMGMEAELAKLEFNLGGVRDMERLPDAVFVADLKTEEIAVNEAARLRIPIIGLVDTNCDPTPVDYVVPGNDDAIRSCELVIGTIGGAIEEGSSSWRVQEEKRIAEEMERRKREEEERRKREEEEKARREAEEAKKAAEDAEKVAAAQKAAQAQAQKAQAPAPQAAAPKAQVQATPAGAAVEAQAAPPEASVAEVKEGGGSTEQPPAPPQESAKAAETEEKAENAGESK